MFLIILSSSDCFVFLFIWFLSTSICSFYTIWFTIILGFMTHNLIFNPPHDVFRDSRIQSINQLYHSYHVLFSSLLVLFFRIYLYHLLICQLAFKYFSNSTALFFTLELVCCLIVSFYIFGVSNDSFLHNCEQTKTQKFLKNSYFIF